MRCRGLLLIVLSIALAGGSQSPADETREASTDARRLAHFEKSIRPALIKYCFECHSRDGEINGGLSLDSRSGWEIGGDSGPAIIPGKPSESRLLKAIRYEDPKLQMPPDRRLPPEVVRDFEKWIADGAADPRTGTGSPKTASGNASADRL
ncbi:MAG TPA: c-type cytochrome domain-containing protein, partial [Caulifigura sp.]|nr:c-type cytochrome domain-containing protein [Caulifigura sp.]